MSNKNDATRPVATDLHQPNKKLHWIPKPQKTTKAPKMAAPAWFLGWSFRRLRWKDCKIAARDAGRRRVIDSMVALTNKILRESRCSQVWMLNKEIKGRLSSSGKNEPVELRKRASKMTGLLSVMQVQGPVQAMRAWPVRIKETAVILRISNWKLIRSIGIVIRVLSIV